MRRQRLFELVPSCPRWNSAIAHFALHHHAGDHPALQIRHCGTDTGESWLVRATWEGGRFEEITGFASEAEANDWIATEFQTWLEEKTTARSD